MTGFGQAARMLPGYRIAIDLKSVNHRYCEIVVRMPKEFTRYESVVRTAVGRYIKRGRVDAFVTIEREAGSPQGVRVDWELALGIARAAEELRTRLSLPEPLQLRDLLAVPGLITPGESMPPADEEAGALLVSCAEEAADALAAMRQREGTLLLADLEERLRTVEQLRQQALQLAPDAVRDHAEKLRLRIAELLGAAQPDETRLAMEIVLYADRCAVDEELTRLHSHLQQCSELLAAGEPVGRKLDFLVQEMNREVNTIGSKSSHAQLASLVVDMKAELEKLREQIQNIE